MTRCSVAEIAADHSHVRGEHQSTAPPATPTRGSRCTVVNQMAARAELNRTPNSRSRRCAARIAIHRVDCADYRIRPTATIRIRQMTANVPNSPESAEKGCVLRRRCAGFPSTRGQFRARTSSPRRLLHEFLVCGV